MLALRKSALFGLCLFVFYFSLGILTVHAAHYRGGTMRYEAVKGRTVKIFIEVFFQRDYSSFKCPKTASCLNKIVNVGTIYTGDGGQINADVKVFFDDKPNNVIGTRAEYIYTFKGTKLGPFKVSWTSCCWIGGAIGPAGPNGDWKLETTVRLDGNNSPVFNSPTFFEWCTTSPFVNSINAVDPDKDKITYKLIKFSKSPILHGMTIDQKGTIRWPKPKAGNWVISIIVEDSKGAVTYRDFLLQIPKTCGNKVPLITLTPDKISVKPNTQACTTAKLSDPDAGNKLELFINPAKPNATTAPKGRQSNPYSFRYCWTPKPADLGLTHNILFTGRDDGKPNLIAQKTFAVSVVSGFPPVFKVNPPGNPQVVQEGNVLKFAVTAVDTDKNGIDTFTATGAPSFCTVRKTAPTIYEIECKPGFSASVGRRYTIVFSAKDKDTPQRTAQMIMSIDVKDFNRPPVASLADQTLTEGKSYRIQVKASDPDGDALEFSMTGLPTNAKMDKTAGLITWTPDRGDVGSHTASIVVSDKKKGVVTIQVKFTVLRGNAPPKITSKPRNSGFVEKVYVYEAKATDPDKSDKLTWKLKTAPAGMKIDPNTGRLTWTPKKEDLGKDVDVEIEVCDSAKPPLCVSQSFKISIREGCQIDKDCTGDKVCRRHPVAKVVWVCTDPGCAANDPKCPSKKDFCFAGLCKVDPCSQKNCGNGEVCRPSDGKCIKPCFGVQCPSGEICVDGKCQATPCSKKPCKSDQVCDGSDPVNPRCVNDPCKPGACKHGRSCFRGRCLDDPCLKMTCPDGKQRCFGGQCIERKDCKKDKDCSGDELCINSKCFKAGCYKTPCPAGQICLKGKCSENPCRAKTCKKGEVCRPTDLACVPICPKCPAGEVCKEGKCVADPCAKSKCTEKDICKEGKCSPNACYDKDGKICKHNRVCKEGICYDNPCTGVNCPDDHICQNGVCYATKDSEPVSDGGEPDIAPEPLIIPLVNGGCLCSGGPNGEMPTVWFLFLFLLSAQIFVRRRRKQ